MKVSMNKTNVMISGESRKGAYNSGKSGNPGNFREFINSGKLRELRINTGNFSDAVFVSQCETSNKP